MQDLFKTLQVQLGSYYVNNFNSFGRSWQVNMQADGSHRQDIRHTIEQLKVLNANKEPVPLSTLIQVRERLGPSLVMRYNLYPAAAIYGEPGPGVGSTSAFSIVENHFNRLQQDATIPPLMAVRLDGDGIHADSLGQHGSISIRTGSGARFSCLGSAV